MDFHENEVAVVIPLYNGAQWILQTLEGVGAQTHPPTEIIVVDDGSADDGPTLIQAMPGVRLVRNPDKGSSPARKYGYSLTRAPLVAFLDQDDLWHPDHLALLVRALAEHPMAPAALARHVDFDEDGHPDLGRPEYGPAEIDPWDHFPLPLTPTSSTMLVRRTELDRCGGYATHYTGAPDYYLTYRLSAEAPLVMNWATTLGRRTHAHSYSANLRNRPSEYVNTLYRAATAALPHRLAVDPAARGVLAARLQVLGCMCELAAALEAGDPDALERQVEWFRAHCDAATDEWTDGVCWMLFWFIAPILSLPSPTAAESLRILVAAWPQGGRWSRVELQRMLDQQAGSPP